MEDTNIADISPKIFTISSTVLRPQTTLENLADLVPALRAELDKVPASRKEMCIRDSLVAILVGIGVFRASGAMDFIIQGVRFGIASIGLNTDFVEALPTMSVSYTHLLCSAAQRLPITPPISLSITQRA